MPPCLSMTPIDVWWAYWIYCTQVRIMSTGVVVNNDCKETAIPFVVLLSGAAGLFRAPRTVPVPCLFKPLDLPYPVAVDAELIFEPDGKVIIRRVDGEPFKNFEFLEIGNNNANLTR
jgi:hypothetical protein